MMATSFPTAVYSTEGRSERKASPFADEPSVEERTK
jgi:hypothetical protein